MSTGSTTHRALAASQWVSRWIGLLAPGAKVLDVACGFGRHSRLAVEHGCHVTAIDRSAEALAALTDLPNVQALLADLEAQPWPIPGAAFDAVVVTNYLHRPLFPELLKATGPSGLLIYETFAAGNERFGRPSSPEFLLRPGELLEQFGSELRVLGFEDVYTDTPRKAMVQRICACGPEFLWSA